ncbi:MAG: hypothetical protein JHC26_04875 [Thermofilum sp.]|jgi:hypothetical protein|uniref:hypothetical protein n=1 Tax=Thermofilum sp. TaxID=1961369 RepID=UPI002583AB43|nr:hypothetical protein [Thermofilum sp.]MCI4408402.1 hypothetical protein [Thermofilum sp.]
MRKEKGILLRRGEIENLYAVLEEALDVIDKYHSMDDAEYSEDPDYAMDKILEKLEEASDILEGWLRRLEEEEKRDE